MNWLWIIAIFIFAETSAAFFRIPSQLSRSEQIRTLQILGVASSSKVIGNPYPLGGNSGIEISMSQELINTEDLAGMSSVTDEKNEVSYSQIYFGKGLYNNVDLFFHFTMLPQQDDISNYGFMMRWGFYEAADFPMSLSIQAYTNTANFDNQLRAQNLGADFISVFHAKDVVLYFGVGRVNSYGRFIGGVGGLTESGVDENISLVEYRSLVGSSVQFKKIFIAGEVSRSTQSSYHFKLGTRF